MSLSLLSLATYLLNLCCKAHIVSLWIDFLLMKNNTESRDQSLCSPQFFQS